MTEKEKEQDLGGEAEALDAPSTDETPAAEEKSEEPAVAQTPAEAPAAAEAPTGEGEPSAEAEKPAAAAEAPTPPPTPAPAKPAVEEVPTVAKEDLPDDVRRQPLYEVMFVVHQGRASDNFQAVHQELERILTEAGGTIRNLAQWDDRRLAYRIGRRHRGAYLLGHFHAPPGAIPQIERACRLSDLVFRILITRDEDGVQVVRPTPR